MDIINLLNVGYERGAVVPRVNTNTYVTEYFNGYCPKCLASTRELTDVLMSRAFVIYVPRTTRPKDFAPAAMLCFGRLFKLHPKAESRIPFEPKRKIGAKEISI